MWNTLNSRRFAVYILTGFLLVLFVSALIPNNFTIPPKEWQELERNSPALFWIYSHLSTPFLVKNPFFQLISFLLFLSTLVCTSDRVFRWHRFKASEFAKEKAFSFVAENTSGHAIESVRQGVEGFLSRGRWKISLDRVGEATILSGQKGMSGFWGSVIFHAGLLFCFLAGPVTALTGFRGEMIVTEGIVLPMGTAIASHAGRTRSDLSDMQVQVHGVRGEYFEGQYKYDFGGTLALMDRDGRRDIPFAVNKPANYEGFQFSLQEFGYAPHLVIEREGEAVFDYYLNLRRSEEGDYFELDGKLRALVMFFPDFFMEGNRIGTRSNTPNNPVTMIKFFSGDREVYKGLFRPGEESVWQGNRIRVPDYRHWVNLSVTREAGIMLVITGFLLGVAGLMARFLSNERRIEFELSPDGVGTSFRVRGYSRYYPAFLEKEVKEIAEMLKKGYT